MIIELAQDARQRAADVMAVMALTRANLNKLELDLFSLGGLVERFSAVVSRQELQRYSTLSWEDAVGGIKIASIKHYLEEQQAGPDELPPPSVDREIGDCLLAAFFKFMTFRAIEPDWYAPHLTQMQLEEGPMPSH